MKIILLLSGTAKIIFGVILFFVFYLLFDFIRKLTQRLRAVRDFKKILNSLDDWKNIKAEPCSIGQFLKANPLYVPHSELRRYGDSEFRSHCVRCDLGVLPMKRYESTLKLKDEDNCTYCGQRYVYIDIPDNTFFYIKEIDSYGK